MAARRVRGEAACFELRLFFRLGQERARVGQPRFTPCCTKGRSAVEPETNSLAPKCIAMNACTRRDRIAAAHRQARSRRSLRAHAAAFSFRRRRAARSSSGRVQFESLFGCPLPNRLPTPCPVCGINLIAIGRAAGPCRHRDRVTSASRPFFKRGAVVGRGKAGSGRPGRCSRKRRIGVESRPSGVTQPSGKTAHCCRLAVSSAA